MSIIIFMLENYSQFFISFLVSRKYYLTFNNNCTSRETKYIFIVLYSEVFIISSIFLAAYSPSQFLFSYFVAYRSQFSFYTFYFIYYILPLSNYRAFLVLHIAAFVSRKTNARVLHKDSSDADNAQKIKFLPCRTEGWENSK